MSVYLNTADLKRLDAELQSAERKVSNVTPATVTAAARGVFADAVSNAQQMADTGELARSVQIESLSFDQGAGVGYRIGAAVRQAFFLEYGSPNTGAPRPWLSAPAAKAVETVYDAIAKAAAPW